LLVADVSKTTGEQTIEVAHEALLRQWGDLQSWLIQDGALLSMLEGRQTRIARLGEKRPEWRPG